MFDPRRRRQQRRAAEECRNRGARGRRRQDGDATEERSLRSHRASSTVFASRSDVPDNIYSPQQRRNKFVLKNGTGSSL